MNSQLRTIKRNRNVCENPDESVDSDKRSRNGAALKDIDYPLMEFLYPWIFNGDRPLPINSYGQPLAIADLLTEVSAEHAQFLEEQGLTADKALHIVHTGRFVVDMLNKMLSELDPTRPASASRSSIYQMQWWVHTALARLFDDCLWVGEAYQHISAVVLNEFVPSLADWLWARYHRTQGCAGTRLLSAANAYLMASRALMPAVSMLDRYRPAVDDSFEEIIGTMFNETIVETFLFHDRENRDASMANLIPSAELTDVRKFQRLSEQFFQYRLPLTHDAIMRRAVPDNETVTPCVHVIQIMTTKEQHSVIQLTDKHPLVNESSFFFEFFRHFPRSAQGTYRATIYLPDWRNEVIDFVVHHEIERFAEGTNQPFYAELASRVTTISETLRLMSISVFLGVLSLTDLAIGRQKELLNIPVA